MRQELRKKEVLLATRVRVGSRPQVGAHKSDGILGDKV